MSYYQAVVLNCPFADAIARTEEALKAQGFGVISRIDIIPSSRRLQPRLSKNWRRQSCNSASYPNQLINPASGPSFSASVSPA